MQGAIFDIDGTVLDSMNAWADVTFEFFKAHNINITREQTIAFQNKSFEESILDIKAKYLPDMTLEDMLGKFFEMLKKTYATQIPAKPYVCEYIHSLHRNGVKLAVASSGFPDLIVPALKRLGIYDCFSAFAYSSEVNCSKSSPDIYLLAAERLGVAPEDSTVYEDILSGIKSAKSAGFLTVAIADDTNIADKDRLIQCSDRYITGWDELLSNI